MGMTISFYRVVYRTVCGGYVLACPVVLVDAGICRILATEVIGWLIFQPLPNFS